MNIFVGSLPYQLGEADLKALFEVYGEVSSAKIITDRETGRSKGFGFVEMPDDEGAQTAIDALNKSEVKGRTIAVSQAENKKPAGGGGGFNRGGGGGGYNRGGNSGGGYNRGGGDRGGYSRGGDDRNDRWK
ncbi:RNA-binding protein [Mucilaginibacter limnophilus]|uniref:RNA-binding protein n=1 Tax=Mucilaginibacter limnophilus TaxID=1932778 RepID=A0A437MUU1_9SPHI|nr:RNA-binding protein [Mucilaginibacter limnophilus]RVU01411.1 RNA-binding protein [Mucilaginibacter limnophilus]